MQAAAEPMRALLVSLREPPRFALARVDVQAPIRVLDRVFRRVRFDQHDPNMLGLVDWLTAFDGSVVGLMIFVLADDLSHFEGIPGTGCVSIDRGELRVWFVGSEVDIDPERSGDQEIWCSYLFRDDVSGERLLVLQWGNDNGHIEAGPLGDRLAESGALFGG